MSWVLLVLLAITFLTPIAGLFSQITPAVFAETLGAASFTRTMENTLISAAGGSILSILLAIYFARKFALYQWRFKRTQRLILLIPYLVPNFILATAYVVGWNPTTGLLNSFVKFPGGLYGLAGMTFLFGVAHMPVAFLLLENKIARIDSSLRAAARLSGASPLEIITRIELPLLIPVVVSAFSLCFALDISAFAIPAWIGAPQRVYPLSYRIYQAIQVGGNDGLPQAGAYSLVLFVSVIPALLLSSWAGRSEKKYVLLSGKASRNAVEKQSTTSTVLFQIIFWLTQSVFWIAPIAALFASTLVKPGCLQDSGLACFHDATLRSYRYVLFDLADTQAAFRGSFVYGPLAAAVIMIVCIATLVGFSRTKFRLKAAEWIFSIPVATPGAIIALGLIVTCSGRFGINLYNTPWIVVVALVLKHLSLAFQPLRTGLSNISVSLVEAAKLSGARTGLIWRKIILPILRPEWMGGFFLVLIPILGELTMSIFLASPSYRSIGTVLFDLQDYADQASAAALAIVLIVVILLINEFARRLSRGKLGY